MKKFDSEKTADFFSRLYTHPVYDADGNDPENFHPRDRILIKYVLSDFDPPNTKVIDYGCGQGRMLRYLLDAGFDAYGMEKHNKMRSKPEGDAKKGAFKEDRIIAGGLEELKTLPSDSYDIFIVMGVFQYMTMEEYLLTLVEAKRILIQGGRLVATFQNAFFDLYTFNKYTIDFLTNELLAPLGSGSQLDEVANSLGALLVNPDKPEYLQNRARDNIYVRLTNPLKVDEELKDAGFSLVDKYFYDFFGLPPLICEKHPDVAALISQRFEVDYADAWQGHFMANAFLVHAVADSPA